MKRRAATWMDEARIALRNGDTQEALRLASMAELSGGSTPARPGEETPARFIARVRRIHELRQAGSGSMLQIEDLLVQEPGDSRPSGLPFRQSSPGFSRRLSPPPEIWTGGVPANPVGSSHSIPTEGGSGSAAREVPWLDAPVVGRRAGPDRLSAQPAATEPAGRWRVMPVAPGVFPAAPQLSGGAVSGPGNGSVLTPATHWQPPAQRSPDSTAGGEIRWRVLPAASGPQQTVTSDGAVSGAARAGR